jgi:hypothetical protein
MEDVMIPFIRFQHSYYCVSARVLPLHSGVY